jgi:hypothetical protein
MKAITLLLIGAFLFATPISPTLVMGFEPQSTNYHIDYEHIPYQFRTYAEPSFSSLSICVFSPQYVDVIQRGLDGWIQISTWLGPGWVNTAPPSRSWTDECVNVISRMVWGEARGVSRNEQKLVVWTVINRLENGNYGNSLISVVRAPNQFHGYSPNFPVTPEIKEMVIGVLEAWNNGETAMVYPPFATTPDYLYFGARLRNGWSHNFFRETW